MKQRIGDILERPAGELAAMGDIAQRVLHESLSQSILQKRIGDALQKVFPPPQ
jgi:hypothetical protein